jgi:hypothetical protein
MCGVPKSFEECVTEPNRVNRIFLKILLWSAGIALVCGLGYLVFGESIVRWAYDGGSIPGIVKAHQPDGRNFEQYYHEASARFWSNTVVGLPLSVLVIFLLYHLYRFLLARVAHQAPVHTEPIQPSQVSGALAAGLICLALTLLCFWPTLATFGSAMIGPPEDNMACYWTLDWAQQNVLHGTSSLTQVNDLFYPEGSSFYFHAWSFYNLIGFCLLRLFVNAVTAYNLLTLHTFVVSGIAGYLFVRYITGNHWSALLGGVLFAFNPAHMIRAQHHMNIATIQFIPLFVLFFVKAVRTGDRSSWLWSGLFLLCNALVDWNYLLYCGWFMVAVYGYLAIRRKQVWLPDVAIGSILTGVVSLLILSPWLIPMIVRSFSTSMGDGGGHNQYVVDLAALVVPGTMHLLFGTSDFIRSINSSYSGFPWETAGYLGLAALGVVLLAWRELLNRSVLLILAGVTFLIFALGSQPHFVGINIPALVPGRLVPLIPLMSNSRALSRTIVFVYLFWTTLVAIAMQYLWQRWARYRLRTLIVGVIVILLIADYVSIARESTPVTAPPCYAALPAATEKYGILDLPSGYREVEHYMMYQRLHGHPIVQGWVSRKPAPTLIDRLELKDLGVQRQQLVENKVKYVVLHKAFLPNPDIALPSYRAEYPSVFEDSSNLVVQVY